MGGNAGKLEKRNILMNIYIIYIYILLILLHKMIFLKVPVSFGILPEKIGKFMFLSISLNKTVVYVRFHRQQFHFVLIAVKLYPVIPVV